MHDLYLKRKLLAARTTKSMKPMDYAIEDSAMKNFPP